VEESGQPPEGSSPNFASSWRRRHHAQFRCGSTATGHFPGRRNHSEWIKRQKVQDSTSGCMIDGGQKPKRKPSLKQFGLFLFEDLLESAYIGNYCPHGSPLPRRAAYRALQVTPWPDHEEVFHLTVGGKWLVTPKAFATCAILFIRREVSARHNRGRSRWRDYCLRESGTTPGRRRLFYLAWWIRASLSYAPIHGSAGCSCWLKSTQKSIMSRRSEASCKE